MGLEICVPVNDLSVDDLHDSIDNSVATDNTPVFTQYGVALILGLCYFLPIHQVSQNLQAVQNTEDLDTAGAAAAALLRRAQLRLQSSNCWTTQQNDSQNAGNPAWKGSS